MMAAMSTDETVDELLRVAVLDQLEPWELIEFLGISMERLLEDYEFEIVQLSDELDELLGITRIEDDE